MDHLSISIAQRFEWYADCADKFVADVESGCPLRRDTFFRCPFLRQLFEGKSLQYLRNEGSGKLWFHLFPMISEGRGIEACLLYGYFDPQRLDKSIKLRLMLRLSESTDIVGIAISCLQSSASLLNLVVEEDGRMGDVNLLSNLQASSYPAGPNDLLYRLCAFLALFSRLDPVCCHADVHKPGSKSIISSELSNVFPEQVIMFEFTCYIPAAECSLPRAYDKAGRIRNAMMIDGTPHLELSLSFAPHSSRRFSQGESIICSS
ncbi:unnamed protein product [Urochloa humidicola]